MTQVALTVEGQSKLAAIVVEAKLRAGTATRLAELTGVSTTTWYKIEKQLLKKNIDLVTLKAISPYTDYSLDELICMCSGKKPRTLSLPTDYLYATQVLPQLEQLLPGEASLLIVGLLQKHSFDKSEVAAILKAIAFILE